MQLLTINGSQFRLSTVDELVRTKAALSAAVLLGGGFVDLPVAGSPAISVFVSPSSAMFVEEVLDTVAVGASGLGSDYPFWLDEL